MTIQEITTTQSTTCELPCFVVARGQSVLHVSIHIDPDKALHDARLCAARFNRLTQLEKASVYEGLARMEWTV